MTLIIKDLSSRLPYKVKALYRHKDIDVEIQKIEIDGTIFYNNDETHYGYIPIDCIKPYLRLPSDLRKEEIDELFRILNISEDKGNWIKINDCTGIKFILPDGIWAEDLIKAYDYLNSIHIDYRGLIEKNLAESVRKEFYGQM